MREIKFRAWNRKNREMFEVLGGGERFDFYIDNPNFSELMQFTGLKDKEGKEIYKGDIFDSPSKNKFYVIWFKDGWFIQNVKDKGVHPIQRLSEVAPYWKIIGNIYEIVN